jgi:putative ABC transport system permease protein
VIPPGLADKFFAAYDSLKQHRLRSLLTILGIVIGITTVIALQSMVNGLNKTVEEQFKSIGADMISVNLTEWGIQIGPRQRKPRKRLTMEDSDAIARQCPSVRAVAPTIYERQQVKYRATIRGPLTICGTSESFAKIENYPVSYGRFLTEGDVARSRAVAVLGNNVTGELFGLEQPVGKTIRIANRSYDVIGVFEEKGAIFGESQDDIIVIPATTFEKQFGKLRTVNISVLPYSKAYVPAAKEEIRLILRRRRGVAPGEEDDFALNTADQLIAQFKQLTGVIFAAMVGIGGLSLLVGGIGIMNIMLVSVTERTREIGIRKALGAKRKTIRFQFMTEAVILCLAGGLLGVLLGLGIATLVDKVSPVPASTTVGTVLVGLIFSSIVGMVFGYFPAARAARLNPIDALHHE